MSKDNNPLENDFDCPRPWPSDLFRKLLSFLLKKKGYKRCVVYMPKKMMRELVEEIEFGERRFIMCDSVLAVIKDKTIHKKCVYEMLLGDPDEPEI
jgi:hypothetical protein